MCSGEGDAGLLLFSPPFLRRGGAKRRGGWPSARPPRRLSPAPLLIRGGERRFQSVTVRAHPVTVRVHPVGTRFRYSTPTLPAAISRNARTVGLAPGACIAGAPPWRR